MPVRYQHSPSNVAWCGHLAGMRFAGKHPTGQFSAENITGYGAHVVGVIAEAGVAAVEGGKVNQMISPRGDRHEPDLIDRQGRKLEVKGTTWTGPKPMLKLSDHELFQDRWYVLVVVQQPDVCFIYPPIHHDDFKNNCRLQDFNHGPRHCLTGEEIEAFANSLKEKVDAVEKGCRSISS